MRGIESFQARYKLDLRLRAEWLTDAYLREPGNGII